MEDIIKEGDIYRSRYHEGDPKKCAINFSTRLPLISSSSSFELAKKEWTHITYGETNEDGVLCICGMKLKKYYHLMNIYNRNLVQIGSTCVCRIDESLEKDYKNSIKKKGYCDICDSSVKNLDSHLESKSHKAKEEKFKEQRKFVFSLVVHKMINKYKSSQNIRAYCDICGEYIDDIKNHNTHNVLSKQSIKTLFYKISRRKINKYIDSLERKCVDCERKISASEPKWKIRCISCFIKKKKM